MKTITIRLGERTHAITLGKGALAEFCPLASAAGLGRRIAIVTDRTVAALHLRAFSASLRRRGYDVTEIIMPSGEREKSPARAEKIVAALLRARHTRSSVLVAFGGGVVGDVAGYAAGTFRRGIPLVQVPTTLLAQIESAIGGKTAVNHPLSKNAMGVFHQPKFILSDVRLLGTLPRREIICGLGEGVKYALLDEAICGFLERHLDGVLRGELDLLERLILLCNRHKARLVSADEEERDPGGGRAVLNLGHTIGHALEVLSRYRLHHGEAVLIGLEWELMAGERSGIVPEGGRVRELLSRIGFRPRLGSLTASALMNYLFAQKRPQFVLPRRIGTVVMEAMAPDVVRSVLRERLGR